MSCDCENISNICIFVDPCNEGTAIGITAATTGTYEAAIQFNSVWSRFSLAGTENEEFVILTSMLNENYVHKFQLTDPSGNLNCFTLSTSLAFSVSNSPTPTPEPDIEELEITVDAEDISTTDYPDDTLTNAWFDGKTIRKIYMGTQVYIRGDGFTQSGDEIIFINGASWLDGQIIIAET